MPGKPNFTGAQLTQDAVQVFGSSDPDDPNDILDIRVVLTQEGQAPGGTQIASASVAELSPEWQADISPEGFTNGPAVAFGVETRRTNVTTTTWAEPIEIQ
jgi:hypothetical protein